MSETPSPQFWCDISVPDATALCDFYAGVTGLTPVGVDMGGYADYTLTDPATGAGLAGVCHARGVNADLPPVWLVYFTVSNLDEALALAVQRGGRLAAGPKGEGPRFAVVQDPAGAYFALYQPQT